MSEDEESAAYSTTIIGILEWVSENIECIGYPEHNNCTRCDAQIVLGKIQESQRRQGL